MIAVAPGAGGGEPIARFASSQAARLVMCEGMTTDECGNCFLALREPCNDPAGPPSG